MIGAFSFVQLVANLLSPILGSFITKQLGAVTTGLLPAWNDCLDGLLIAMYVAGLVNGLI